MSLVSCATRHYDSKSDIIRQKIIVDAYFKYQKNERVTPKDLGQIVERGYLPKYGDIYSGYWDFSISPKKLSYIDSDYKIFNSYEGDQNKILGIRSLDDPNKWHFRGEIIVYVKRKRENIEYSD